MNSAFIPIFQGLKEKKDQDAFFNYVFFSFFLFLSCLSIFVFFEGAQLINDFFFILDEHPNLGEFKANTTALIKIIFPYIVFVSLMSVCHGVLNSFHKFKTTSLPPILFNVILILGIALMYLLVVSGRNSTSSAPGLELTTYLAGLILLAGIVNLVHGIYSLKKLGYTFRVVKSFKNLVARKEFKHFLQLMLPVLLSSGVYQLNALMMDPFALAISSGGVAILFYCSRLFELPLGIIGVSITTASLPRLASQRQQNKLEEMKGLVIRSMNLVFLLFIPVITIFFFYHEKIISLIFEWGNFTREQTKATAEVFFFYIFSLLPIPLYRIILNVFYAFNNTKLPFFAALISLIINLFFLIILTKIEMKITMIALAATISSYSFFIFLAVYLKRSLGLDWYPEMKSLLKKWLKIIIIPIIVVSFFKVLIDPLASVLEIKIAGFYYRKIFYLLEIAFFTFFFFFNYLIILLFFRERETITFFKLKK